MRRHLAKSRAFTLIELLVVVAIIGILATIIIISYTNAQAKARDNKRKADIQAIAAAIEAFHADRRVYPYDAVNVPAGQNWYRVRSCNSLSNPDGGPNTNRWSSGLNGLLNGYIPLPMAEDPKQKDNTQNHVTWHADPNEYFYTYLTSKYSYVLAAHLEIANDGNGRKFFSQTLRDTQGQAMALSASESLKDFSSAYTSPEYPEIFFVGSNLVSAP
ncbi:MAG: prepilin-type N-terminal cleavage/methylation domain-containing protein [Patescibacteria group bacterium]|jgi:prepilin-type N-terminal cleavage/methylation domain-containing protein